MLQLKGQTICCSWIHHEDSFMYVNLSVALL